MSTTTIPYPATPTIVAPVIERNGAPIHCPDYQLPEEPRYQRIAAVGYERKDGPECELFAWYGPLHILQRVAWWANTGWLLYRPTAASTWLLLTLIAWRHHHQTIAVETTDVVVRATHLAIDGDLSHAPYEEPCIPTPDDLRQFDTYFIQNPISYEQHERSNEEVRG